MLPRLRTIILRISKVAESRTYTLWCACACLLSISFFIRKADNDLFARVATGRLIVRDGAVPTNDVFAFSPTKELWIDHEWLSAVIFYLTSARGGDIGLFLLTVGCGFLTLLLLARAQRERAPQSAIAPLLIFLVVFPSSFIWNSIVRCHVFSFLLFAYLLFAVARYRAAPSLALAASVPLTMVVWVNCHGGFIVGYGLLVTTLIALMWEGAKGTRAFAAAVGISLLGVCATPYGIEYLRFMAHALSMPRPAVSEWSSPTLWSSAHLLFIVAIAGTGAALISQRRRSISLEGRLFLIAAAYAALTHQRLIPFFLFAACVFLPPAMPQLDEIQSTWLRSRLRALRRALLTVSGATGPLGIGVVAFFVATLRDFSLDRSEYPVQTLQWMRQHTLSGKVLVPFNQGSYVLMKGYPELRVSIDGRYEEVYTQRTFETALAAMSPNSPHFSEAFAELAPDFIILCKSGLPLSSASLFPGVWQPLFIQDNKECGVFGDPQRVHAANTTANDEPHWLLHF